MGDVVNLNDRRKQKARQQKTSDAAANRLKFGQTKAARELQEKQSSAEVRRLDGAKRDRDHDHDDPESA